MVLNDVYRVMAVDALASSHPLSSPANEINTPDQIMELFDSITYSKVKPPGFCPPSDPPESQSWGGKGCIPQGASSQLPAALGMLDPGSQLGLLSPLSSNPREPQSSGCCPIS